MGLIVIDLRAKPGGTKRSQEGLEHGQQLLGKGDIVFLKLHTTKIYPDLWDAAKDLETLLYLCWLILQECIRRYLVKKFQFSSFLKLKKKKKLCVHVCQYGEMHT